MRRRILIRGERLEFWIKVANSNFSCRSLSPKPPRSVPPPKVPRDAPCHMPHGRQARKVLDIFHFLCVLEKCSGPNGIWETCSQILFYRSFFSLWRWLERKPWAPNNKKAALMHSSRKCVNGDELETAAAWNSLSNQPKDIPPTAQYSFQVVRMAKVGVRNGGGPPWNRLHIHTCVHEMCYLTSRHKLNTCMYVAYSVWYTTYWNSFQYMPCGICAVSIEFSGHLVEACKNRFLGLSSKFLCEKWKKRTLGKWKNIPFTQSVVVVVCLHTNIHRAWPTYLPVGLTVITRAETTAIRFIFVTFWFDDKEHGPETYVDGKHKRWGLLQTK